MTLLMIFDGGVPDIPNPGTQFCPVAEIPFAKANVDGRASHHPWVMDAPHFSENKTVEPVPSLELTSSIVIREFGCGGFSNAKYESNITPSFLFEPPVPQFPAYAKIESLELSGGDDGQL